MLAGISTEYYVRLEQGRDRRPSPLGLFYAETGSKSDEAVATLAATMGEPNTPPLQDAPARRAQTS
jgi:hypothetical protein